MYDTVVAGFDGSAPCRDAVDEALSLMGKGGGRLVLAHGVYFDNEEFGIAPEQLERRLRAGRELCAHTIEEMSSLNGVGVECRVRQGEAPDVIVDVAAEEKADLVAMGTMGRKGLNRLIMGSVTSRVIVNSPADVLVLKARRGAGSARKSVLLAFDGSEFSERALARACRLSEAEGAKVTVLYVIPRYEEMLEFFKTDSIKETLRREAGRIVEGAASMAAALGVEARVEADEGQAAERVVEAAKRLGADLIVMGTYGHRGVNRAIMGSTAERVIINAPCPVLVVR